MSQLISDAMALISLNSLVGLTKNKKEEAKFIDNSVAFWKERYNPKLTEIMKKINENWKKKS